MDETETPSIEQVDAETALRAALDDIWGGGGMAIFQDFTSAAYVDLLKLLPHFSDLPTPDRYEIVGCESEDSEYSFDVQLITPERNVDIFMVMKRIGEVWKVARLKVPGVRD